MSRFSLKDFLAFEWSDDNNNAQNVPGQRKEAIMIDMEPARSKHKSSDDVDKPAPSKHFKFVSSDDIEEFAHVKALKATVYSTSGLLRTSLTGPNNATPTTSVLQFQQVSCRMVNRIHPKHSTNSVYMVYSIACTLRIQQYPIF